jgi:NACalpha-BTF3-like transcription factor
MSSLKLVIGRCAISISNRWMKRMVIQILEGSLTIWTGAKEGIFSIFQPKVNRAKFEKNNKKYEEEGSVEKEEGKDSRN